MACDICGKTGTPLEVLRDGYATTEIQAICPGCAKIVNGKVWAIHALIDGIAKTLIRRFMGERRAAAAMAPAKESEHG